MLSAKLCLIKRPKRGWGTPALSLGVKYPLFAVPGRVLRDLSAVGKTPKKSRRRKLQLYFPRTIPRRREALPCSAPPGVLPAYQLTFLQGKFLHPLAIRVPLQIETARSNGNFVCWNRRVWKWSMAKKLEFLRLYKLRYLLQNTQFLTKIADI